MPIQIIDNFDLTTAKPIDNRIVVGPTPSFYQNKDSIPNKYQGMRIWELPGAILTAGGTNSTANGLAYVWTGSTWIGENTTSISGSGTTGRVAYFTSPNSIQSTNIYFANNNVGIGASADPSSGARLSVLGDIKTSTNFVGPGSGITSINASNISTGILNISRLPGNSNPGWILTSDTLSSASYKNPNTITVATSSATQQVQLTNRSGVSTPVGTNNAIHYFVFYDGTSFTNNVGNKQLYTNTSNPLSIQPSTGNIGINLTSVAAQALDINGRVRIRGGWPGSGKLLLSENSNGDAMWATASDVGVPVGAIIMWGGAANAIPTNWVLCDGRALISAQNTLLRDQLINQSRPFGQDTSSNPRVPDLRERFVVGAGSGGTGNVNTTQPVGGSGYSVAAFGGSDAVALTRAQIPKHTHRMDADTASISVSVKPRKITIRDGSGEIVSNDPDDASGSFSTNSFSTSISGNTGDGTTNTTGNLGGLAGQAHENRPPFYALCFIIKVR